MAVSKQSLRSALSACRAALASDYVAGVSRAVQSRLLESRHYRACDDLVLYAAKDNEIATGILFRHAIRSRRVFFPKIHTTGGSQLSLVRVADLSQLAPGAFGILEPTGTEITPLAELRRPLICAPGLAFSPCGQRLGRGGGFYDRLLRDAAPHALSAGLGFSFQVLDRLPEAPHDRRLDLIVTQSALFTAAPEAAAAALPGQGGIPTC